VLWENPMSMSQKAEVSTEFIAFFAILLLFFVFFIGIIGINNRDISESTIYTNAGKILDTVTNEINTASRIEGYYRDFSIPEKLSDGENYSIVYYTDLRIIKIEWGQGKNIIENMDTNNVTGSIIAGDNKIKNEYGEVKINAS